MDPEEFRKQLKKWGIIASFFALALLFFALEWRAMLMAYVLVVGVLAIAAVLIQSGRGGGLAASLGGAGGDSMLGARSATPIARATYVMLGLFIFICMLMSILGPRRPASALNLPEPEPAPGLTVPDEMPAPASEPTAAEGAMAPEGSDAPSEGTE